MPATGKSVGVQLIDILRFDEDGLVAEHWGVVDMMAMMQQLGVVGSGAPAWVTSAASRHGVAAAGLPEPDTSRGRRTPRIGAFLRWVVAFVRLSSGVHAAVSRW